MEKILVSRCLLGHPVRYDGGGFDPQAQLLRWQDEGRGVAVCPEVAAALNKLCNWPLARLFASRCSRRAALPVVITKITMAALPVPA